MIKEVILKLLFEFPIIGDLRGVMLIIEWTFAFICLELALIFCMKYFKLKKGERSLQEIGYASLFFGFSFMWYFFIIADYYLSEEIITPFLIWSQGSERALFLNLGYFSLMIGAFSFIRIMEKFKIYLFRKYFFSIWFIILIVLFWTFFFIDIDITQNLAMMFWPPFIIFLVIYLIDFVKIMQNNENILIGILKYLPAFLLLIVGFALTTDIIIEPFGLGFRLVGSIFQLISTIILFYYFINLPSFTEFEWQEKIEELYLIEEAGICLFHKAFIDKIEFDEDQLISSALSSINMVLNELTQENKKGISIIKKEGKILTIYTSDYVSAVLFSKEELEYINISIEKFVKKVEKIYGNVLIDWKGNLDIFASVENLVDEIFIKKTW